MQRKAFDGRVIFEIRGSTLRELVIRQGFVSSIPNCHKFSGDPLNLLANLIIFISRTSGVITDIEEDDPNIVALAHFWDFARDNGDYNAIWNAFLDLPDIAIHDEWLAALNVDDQLKAPDEVQINAPDDEALDAEKKSAEMST